MTSNHMWRPSRSPRTWQRLAAGAITVAVACTVAGCQGLPTSGAVTEFEPHVPDERSLSLKGFGPQQGASADVIVRDFLRASAAGWSDDFQVARAYLTETANTAWKPETQVQIYANDALPEIVVAPPASPATSGKANSATATTPGAATSRDDLGGDTVEASISVAINAYVTPRGDYHVDTNRNAQTIHLTLIRTADEQWRIDSLPDSVLISESTFRTAFQQSSVYFLAPDAAALVADMRWYPRRRLATYLMQALLDGPSPLLDGAVATAIPAGTQLPTYSVDIVDGVARVQLSGASLMTSRDQALFNWQVRSTLLQVPSVSDVSISIGGIGVVNTDVPSGPQYAMNTQVGLVDDHLVVVDGGATREIPLRDATGIDVESVTTGPVHAAPIVMRRGDMIMRVDSSGNEVEVTQVPGATVMSVDRLGYVWVLTNRRIVVTSEANPLPLELPWTDAGDITDMRVSPDGARLLVTRSGTHPSVWMAAIARNAMGAPVSLGQAYRIEGIPGVPRDASWAGNNTVAILAAGAGGARVAIAQGLSVRDDFGAPDDAVALSGGASENDLRLSTADGRSYQRAGVSWRNVDTLSSLHYPR